MIKNYINLVSCYSAMKTTKVIAEKAHCSIAASLMYALKMGFISVTGAVLAKIAPLILDGKLIIDVNNTLAIGIACYGIIGYMTCNYFESRLRSEIEVIKDILAIRLARTGKKGS